MEGNSTRAEAERLLGISEKLLQKQDLNGSKEFAILAQETDPLMEGTDQIVAVVDVLMASQKPISNTHDWYAILQLDRRTEDLDTIKRQYRRLALLLHPDKNKFPFADSAFRLVADAWAVLSDGGRKSLFDSEVGLFAKVDLVASRNQRDHQQQQQQNKLPVRRTAAAEGSAGVRKAGPGASAGETRSKTFWTTCPYCYNLYEYPRMYEECCMRCQNCSRAFHAAVIPSLPPVVPGKEEYYCCWGFFPVGFGDANSGGGGGGGEKQTFPVPPTNSVPPPNSAPPPAAPAPVAGGQDGGFVNFPQANVTPTPKKRGRPRKNVPV